MMNAERKFALLASAPRRRVLTHLFAGDGLSTVDELAALLADDGSADYDRSKIQLHHTHLPKLADYGVVEYDSRNGDVVLTDEGAELASFVEANEDLERPLSTQL